MNFEETGINEIAIYEQQKYPMSLLLDYALLPKKQNPDDSDEEQPERAWEKVINEPSMVYKLDDALKFPVSLENMRFQVHLFKRI